MKKILGFLCLLAAVLSLSACTLLNDVANFFDLEQEITIDELRDDVKNLPSHPYTQATVTGYKNYAKIDPESYTYADGTWTATTDSDNYIKYVGVQLDTYKNSIESESSDTQKDFKIYRYTISRKYKIVYEFTSNSKSSLYALVKDCKFIVEFDKYGCQTSCYFRGTSITTNETSIEDVTTEYK